jgi:hypothetical protein
MAENTNNRMVLLLIGGIPVTMILVSTWLWYFVKKGDLDLVGALGTANQGTLIQPPRRIDDQELFDGSGMQVRYDSLPLRWTMVIPGRGARCGAGCEGSLYVTRQIRVAMGKDFNRLRRFYVSAEDIGDTRLAVQNLSDGQPAPEHFADYLAQEHGRLQAFSLSASAYDTLFAEHGVDDSTWYLVDPAGWVMMSYNKDDPYKDVISDLKFLLKNSGG